ncbi:MAG: hypothetical protein JWO15_3737 [Sphingomonadales bacterium]|nr:hypothetical protein [Sphingomonadales bacterium]
MTTSGRDPLSVGHGRWQCDWAPRWDPGPPLLLPVFNDQPETFPTHLFSDADLATLAWNLLLSIVGWKARQQVRAGIQAAHPWLNLPPSTTPTGPAQSCRGPFPARTRHGCRTRG